MAQDDIQGQVVDPSGNPVSGAIVELTKSFESNPVEEQTVLRTTTDSNGNYIFEFLPDGDGTTQDYHVSCYNYDGSAYVNSFNNPGVTADLRESLIPDSALTQDLVAWYRFEDGDARDYASSAEFPNVTWGDSTAYDGTVNGPTHQSNGGVTDFDSGASSGYFVFDDGDIIEIPADLHDRPDRNQEITMMAWVKGDFNNNSYYSIFGGGDHFRSTGLTVKRSGAFPPGPAFSVIIDDDLEVQSLSSIPDTSYHHWCGRWDGNNAEFYFDGINASNASATGTNSKRNVNTQIGALSSNFHDSDFEIDDARIYNTALSESQINDIFNNTKP